MGGPFDPPPPPSLDVRGLNEYEICLRMQEMAILETQIFKNFWGAYHRPPRKLAPSAVVGAPSLESSHSLLPLFNIIYIFNITSNFILKQIHIFKNVLV